MESSAHHCNTRMVPPLLGSCLAQEGLLASAVPSGHPHTSKPPETQTQGLARKSQWPWKGEK